ncbi:L,D-transpeptidase family protein [Aliihoeflea aestuarii]|jgi:lipoprotein-anchoring transpeptidase ErfK/SrfK|uniref:L,D-transpeptidase family protein n=1 Tax=Aliihoeflea aestuarii TaxID=453840 RepID=UPI0020963B60|nr:L,D-transpeptidase family protein [Aliihoeflea aestuarii]MCO6392535.1 L,D-transpeptidase family protein [Aliihoeflea aestuarii]
MITRPFSFSLLALFVSAGAASAALPDRERPQPSAKASEHVQLAQREVDVYYDQFGREVLVDPYTGEIVGIVGEQGGPVARERYVEPDPWGGEYVDPYERDPYAYEPYEDDRRLRREQRMRELGRYPGARPNGFPDVREAPQVAPREEPSLAAPAQPDGGVTRQPLDEPSTASLGNEPDVTQPGLTQPGSVIEVNPQNQPPSISTPRATVSGASEDVAKIQIVLSRIGASPGVVDGRMGDNVNKAIAAYRDLRGEALRTYDTQSIEAILQETGGDAFVDYEITAVDAAGPFIASVPADYGEKAQLEHLGYTSVAEKLAERFHMDENYLRALNPGLNFDRPGTRIRVANVPRPKREQVARIIADKSAKQVRAYDASGGLVVAYPATIGSQGTPSPTGTHTVERIALDPEYTYNPKINFQQGDNDRVLRIPPGPNGPVGSVWIALSKPTYGIHGTPDPSKIGKTYSNGCIRLTNWDAQELAKLVSKGVTVEFQE